jgi:hypothetical protein
MSDSAQSIEAPLKPSGSRKKLYMLAVAVLIVALSGSILLYSFRPVEAIALSLQYKVGEKMTYEINMTISMEDEFSYTDKFSYTMVYSMEVLDKEGDIYTIRMTTGIRSQNLTITPTGILIQNQTVTIYSLTMKITESGEFVELVDAPEEVEKALQEARSSFSFMPGNGFYFPLSEAKVGDSWQVPIGMTTEMFNFTGTLNCAITESRKITVPAGTYDAFKLEVSSSDLDIAFSPELATGYSIDFQMAMNGYEYFEKGTCRTIQATFNQTTSATVMDTTVTMEFSMDMQLTEHIKP